MAVHLSLEDRNWQRPLDDEEHEERGRPDGREEDEKVF